MVCCVCRLGAFECHPELTRYSGSSSSAPLSNGPYEEEEDSEPPSLSYASSQLTQSHTQDSSGSDSEEEEGEGEDRMEHSGTDDITALGERGIPPGEIEISDWESLEPDPADLRAVEAITDRTLLTSTDTATRERMRRLDYDSTYLDYLTLMGASGTEKSVQLTATDSVRLLESLDEEGEGLTAAGKPDEGGQLEGAARPEASGLFGTLSSLWGSTFGSKTS